jgi:hypothetical protein
VGEGLPVISYGVAAVALDSGNTATLGDIVCLSSTTAGLGHSSSAACTAPNLTIGVVIGIQGTLAQAQGSGIANATITTSLPVVQLRIGH